MTSLDGLALTEIVVMLERATIENAAGFIALAVDVESGEPMSASGPFAQAEQALAQCVRDERAWREQTVPEDGGIRCVVVPLWGVA